VGKLKDQSPRVLSISMTSMGDGWFGVFAQSVRTWGVDCVRGIQRCVHMVECTECGRERWEWVAEFSVHVFECRTRRFARGIEVWESPVSLLRARSNMEHRDRRRLAMAYVAWQLWFGSRVRFLLFLVYLFVFIIIIICFFILFTDLFLHILIYM